MCGLQHACLTTCFCVRDCVCVSSAAGVFMDNEMSDTLSEIHKYDKDFNLNDFTFHMERVVIPAVIEVWLTVYMWVKAFVRSALSTMRIINPMCTLSRVLPLCTCIKFSRLPIPGYMRGALV